MKPYYKLHPKWILEDIFTKLGDSPGFKQTFKKTPRGYLIHSSASSAQYVFGIFLTLVSAGILVLLFSELQNESIKKNWLPQTMASVQIAFAALFILSVIVALIFMSLKRISWLNASLNDIMITNSLFLIGIPKIIKKEEIRAVRLEAKYAAQPKTPIWSIAIETHRGNPIPITMKMFSEKPVFFSDFKMEYKLAAEFPKRAWILSRTLDAPLHVVAKEININIRSSKELLAYTDQEKHTLKTDHEKENAEANKRIAKINRNYGLFFGLCLLVMLGSFLYDVIDRGSISKLNMLILSSTAFSIACAALIYYLFKRSSK